MKRVVLCLGMLAGGLAAQPGKRIEVRGTYADPKPFWAKGARLNDYGVNAVFVHSGTVNAEMMSRARAEARACSPSSPC